MTMGTVAGPATAEEEDFDPERRCKDGVVVVEETEEDADANCDERRLAA
jgi:hypothetical protein